MSAQEIQDADVVVEAEVLPARSMAIVPHTGSTELIVAESPAEQIRQASAMATELDKVIREQGMRTKMGRRKVVKPDGKEVWEDSYHTNVEAWQTLAAFLRVAIVPDDPEPIRDNDGNVKLVSYEVTKEFYAKGTTGAQIRNGSATPERVERATVDGAEGFTCRCLVYKDGVVVGAGSSRCTRLEESWRSKPDYALEGMAQTRAIGRSMATPGRWIVTLAGYNGTPAEEMPPQADEPEDSGPAFGPGVDNDLLAKTRGALGYMLSVDPADQTVTGVLRKIDEDAGNTGYLPAIACRAVCRAGAAVKAQAGVGSLAAVEFHARESVPAAGSVEPPALNGQSMEEDLAKLRDAGCICPDPFGTGEPDGKRPGVDNACPIRGHGIPF